MLLRFFHACRLRGSGEFVSDHIRFVKQKGADIVLGKLKEGGGWAVREIRFDPALWPPEAAKESALARKGAFEPEFRAAESEGNDVLEWNSDRDGPPPDLSEFSPGDPPIPPMSPEGDPPGDPPNNPGNLSGDPPENISNAPGTLTEGVGNVSGSNILELYSAKEAGDPEGGKWEVVIIAPGLSRNGNYYPPETLREAAPKFEGARAYVYEFDGRKDHLPGSVENKGFLRNLVGWYTGSRFEEGRGIVATLNILNSAKGIREMVREAVPKRLLGLSIDANGKFSYRKMGARLVRWVENIIGVGSVDIVSNPAAGGKFERLLASINPIDQEVETMKALIERLKKAFPGVVFEDGEGQILESVVLEKIEELMTRGISPDEVKGIRDELDAMRENFRKSECSATLTSKLAESKLPEVAQTSLREQFSGRIFEEKDLDKAIEEMRKVVSAFQGDPPGPDTGPVTEGGPEHFDKLQAGLDKAFGLDVPEALQGVPAFRSIRRAYNEFTRNLDPDVTGIIRESDLKRLTEAFSTATFSYALGNTLHRRLVKDYGAVDYGERKIASVISANDFKTREAVRTGYFGDIAPVDPESADYAELSSYADEEATYTVSTRGNIVTVTRKAIINDDLGALQKIPGRLGRAARRTLATFVWTFISGNGAIYDGDALFHANHANTGTDALATAPLQAGIIAIGKQAEPGSSARLALFPKTLVVPVDLQFTANQLVGSPAEPTANMGHATNPTYGKAEVFVNPLLSDANNWYLFADPADVDIIELAFLNGQEEPELFLANNPTVGQMFVADKLQYKIRHEYGGAVVDYRGAYGAIVA